MRQARALAKLGLTAALLGSCSSKPSPVLQQFGGMREVMREGHVEGRVRLADLGMGPSTIGVGALEGLAGEITIAGGEVHLATAVDLVLRDSTDVASHRATLLSIATPGDLSSEKSATPLDETSLARRAAEFGPLAAVDVVGTVEHLELHVTRGACPHGVTTPATAPLTRSVATGTTVQLVGFYAENAGGVLTHHGTAFHLHAIVTESDGTHTSGHVDAFSLREGALVHLGRIER